MERWVGGTEDGEEREGKRRMKRKENETWEKARRRYGWDRMRMMGTTVEEER
jgi:hypothetical protein